MTTRVTIKLPIGQVIETLKQKLTEREQFAKDYGRLETKYEKDKFKWETDCIRWLFDNKKSFEWATAEEGRYNSNDKVLVKFAILASKLPEAPKPPRMNNQTPENYRFEEETEELAEAVKLLTMAKEAGQETISTGSYRNLSKWL